MNDKLKVKRVEYELSNKKQIYLLNGYKFRLKPELKKTQTFSKSMSVKFSVSPDSLTELATDVVRKFKLPEAFSWTCINVQTWIESIGYLQYKEAFQRNIINGHTLILVDTSALSKMNIKNHTHTRHIAKSIRKLYGIDITNYFRNIFIPFHHLWVQYLLHFASRAPQSQKHNVIDFWRKYQILKPIQRSEDHWKILEIWLKNPKLLETSNQYFIGCGIRSNLYKNKQLPNEKLKMIKISNDKYTNLLQNISNSSRRNDNTDMLVVSSLEYDKRIQMLEKAKIMRIVKETKKMLRNQCICSEDPCRCLSFTDFHNNFIPAPTQPKSFILSTIPKEHNNKNLNGRRDSSKLATNISSQETVREKLLMVLPTITDTGDD